MCDAAADKPTSTVHSSDWTVSKWEICLADVSLQRLTLEAAEPSAPSGVAFALDCRGRLVQRGDERFDCEVAWELKCSDGGAPPFALSGVFVLTFTHKPDLPEEGAKYYADVNSVILAYPYVRELVSSIALRATGQAVFIKPLDVPKYVITKRAEWRRALEEARKSNEDGAAEEPSFQQEPSAGEG